MQKFSTPKAFLCLTLLFVLIAVASFAAFKETEQLCSQANGCQIDAPLKNGEMFWDVISRQFLTLFPV